MLDAGFWIKALAGGIQYPVSSIQYLLSKE